LDLGLTHITLRDFRDPYSGDVFDGKQAPYMPAYDAGLRVDYQHATGWFGGVDVISNGRTYYTEDENRLFSQSAYTLVGGRLGWGGQRLRVSVSGANLTNERYYSSITPGPFHGTPGAPRTWVIEAALRF
jgi:iron complex outermembrane recepter protein